MTILKKNRKSTTNDLIAAITKLLPLLSAQDEEQAVEDLKKATEGLRLATSGSPEEKAAIDVIIEAFEGEHELMAYTFQREGNQWTEAEELSQASSRVITLARRLR